ncbi:CD81 antigen [Salvelinus sp. IW2-2015]|uniref:CD81 antigen n=1 Tax=Salvelinus sp. IW2-2015 TaxID=2691554 RepID=UPI0038D493DD
MAVVGCTLCIKFMLFFFNFVFWLAGGVILGVALWLRHDNQTSSLLMQQFEDQQAPSTFYISNFFQMLGCGLFAWRWLLEIWGISDTEDTISKEMINFYDAAYIKSVDVVDSPSKTAAIKVLEVFHETLDCCGKGDDSPLFVQVTGALCPKKSLEDALLKPSNCHLKLKDLFSEKLYLIGLVALAVAVIMIFEMIFTMVLCCGIRNATPVY